MTEQLHWPFVRALRVFELLESTSDAAREALQDPACPLPMAVWARLQTGGRGQRQSAWWSDEGSLTFTLALDPQNHGLRIEQEPRLALMAAVAVIEAIVETGLGSPGLGIRWPNDVECRGRKLGGILPERVETAAGNRLLVGIGLNVRSRLDSAPAAVRGMATSLESLRGSSVDPALLPTLLARILARFDRNLTRLVEGDPELPGIWNRLDLLRGQPVRVALGPRILQGEAQGIDEQGALRIHDGQQLHHLFGGQILRDAVAEPTSAP